MKIQFEEKLTEEQEKEVAEILKEKRQIVLRDERGKAVVVLKGENSPGLIFAYRGLVALQEAMPEGAEVMRFLSGLRMALQNGSEDAKSLVKILSKLSETVESELKEAVSANRVIN